MVNFGASQLNSSVRRTFWGIMEAARGYRGRQAGRSGVLPEPHGGRPRLQGTDSALSKKIPQWCFPIRVAAQSCSHARAPTSPWKSSNSPGTNRAVAADACIAFLRGRAKHQHSTSTTRGQIPVAATLSRVGSEDRPWSIAWTSLPIRDAQAASNVQGLRGHCPENTKAKNAKAQGGGSRYDRILLHELGWA